MAPSAGRKESSGKLVLKIALFLLLDYVLGKTIGLVVVVSFSGLPEWLFLLVDLVLGGMVPVYFAMLALSNMFVPEDIGRLPRWLCIIGLIFGVAGSIILLSSPYAMSVTGGGTAFGIAFTLVSGIVISPAFYYFIPQFFLKRKFAKRK